MLTSLQLLIISSTGANTHAVHARLENIKKQQALKLKQSHEHSLQLLKSQERPFSFYGKALAKEEALKQHKPPTAKDFQQTFQANPIPKSSLEV